MALPVDKLNRDLEGEFRFRGRPVSVPFALPGDLVQFRTERQGRRGVRVQPTHIERALPPDPSVLPAIPFCDRFGVCGGCRGQHLAYSYQLELKAAPIQSEMLTRFGIRPDVVPAPLLSGFRNRMDFVVEGQAIGLRPAGDYQGYVDLSTCPVQTAEANEVLALLRKLLAEFSGAGFVRGLQARERPALRDFPESPGGGKTESAAPPSSGNGGPLKYATIRSGSEGGMLVLSVARESGTAQSAYFQLRDALLARLPTTWNIVECEVDPRAEVSCVPGGRVLRGSASFAARLGGRTFDLPYDAFFQPSPAAFDRIVDWANATLRQVFPEQGSISVADLYCGVGALGGVIASAFPAGSVKLTGFDCTGSAIRKAPSNVLAADSSARFVVCDLNAPPADLFARRFDLVILDPPRAGISPLLRKQIIRECHAPFLLYVSCNPRSQLSDLSALAAVYSVQAACIVDCFPHTGHLEQAVLLARPPGQPIPAV